MNVNVPFASITLLLTLLPVLAGAQAPLKPGWAVDPRTGCKAWDESPKPGWQMTWSGGCVNGLAEGSGTLQWTAGGKMLSRYVGGYRAGKMNGQGVYSWVSGNRYEGEFANDNFNGHGVMIFANGDRFEGLWKDDKANGQGTKTTADGKVYSGTWTNGCFRQGDRWATVGATAKQCGFERK